MSNTVVICEKPSQARNLRAALGSRFGQILPAAGHIIELKEPEEVREDWKTWSAGLLWPGQFYPKKPKAQVRQYLDAIRTAVKSADQVIVATDCDREGQLIGEEILDFIGFRGKRLRAIFNAEDEKSLRDAFGKLRPASDFAGLYASGQAREQADQIVNLSLTRTASVVMKTGGKGAIGIGRVKTPVLGILCRREKEILNFVPRDLYEVDATVDAAGARVLLTCGRLPASLVKEGDGAPSEEEDLDEGDEALAEMDPLRGRIAKREIAEGLAAAVRGQTLPLLTTSERKRQSPPKLFDLTALSAAASNRFGWSGEKTLSVAQSLYSEKKIITYPRGEAQYLPENNIGDVPVLVPALLALGSYREHASLLGRPEIRKGKSGHFSDKALEGYSHHAIIPNVNATSSFAVEAGRLSADEVCLFDMIVRQYLAALAPDHEYQQVTIRMLQPWKGHDWEFRTSGRTPLVPGWKAILSLASRDDEGPELPAILNKTPGNVRDAALRTVTTKPPARYSEGALLKVMKEAWRLVGDNQAMRDRLKEADGIGTPATRGEVIKGLVEQGQVARKGKTLQPTETGMKIYDAILAAAPNLVDPARTAIWETIFDSVQKGSISAEDAVKRILVDAQKEIEAIKATPVRIQLDGADKPTSQMQAYAKAIAERKGIDLPKGALSSSAVCRAFIDANAPPRQKSETGEMLPSEAQLGFAMKIAASLGIDIPAEAKRSSKDLSAWIDAKKKTAPAPPPSEKQLAFATKLANEKGIDLPAEVKSDMKACSAFIDKHMSGGGKTSSGGRTPSPAGPNNRRRSS